MIQPVRRVQLPRRRPILKEWSWHGPTLSRRALMLNWRNNGEFQARWAIPGIHRWWRLLFRPPLRPRPCYCLVDPYRNSSYAPVGVVGDQQGARGGPRHALIHGPGTRAADGPPRAGTGQPSVRPQPGTMSWTPPKTSRLCGDCLIHCAHRDGGGWDGRAAWILRYVGSSA